jgi:hypothetical protein
MTTLPPASREEIAELLGEVDESYIDRVSDTGASVDEIGEAIDLVDDEQIMPRRIPSSISVAAVQRILEELLAPNAGARDFPLRGIPVGHPV